MLLHMRLASDKHCVHKQASYNMTAVETNWPTRQIATVNTVRRKSVHFADTKGLALVSTFFFTKEQASLGTDAERQQFRRITTAFRKSRQAKRERLLNYKSPIPARQFEENIQMNNVCLEKTYSNGNGIYGRIQVKNIAYEKDITVRYTVDSWATCKDKTANYIPGASIGDTDTFFFHIPPPASSLESRMEFAICYRVDGKTYWDNNFGDNYRLLYLPS